MLLHNYTLRVVLSDCNPSSQKVNAIADLSEDISEGLPYLNTVLKGLQYHHDEKFLTVKRKGHVITFWSRQIAVTKLEDEKEAREVIEELKEIVNETYANRDHIKPTYTSRHMPRPLVIFKLLPGKNCKECGEPTCMAFAVKLVGQEIAIGKCVPLFLDEFKEKRKVLLDLLHAAGYEVPGTYLESKEV
jgi:ArsR family metal-binding transcriptional regulator